VLPLDADDLLLDTSVAELVAQLKAAGPEVGFIYPNLQYFGNRTGLPGDVLVQPPRACFCANQCATGA